MRCQRCSTPDSAADEPAIRGRALERLARDAHVIALRERPRPAAALAAAGAAA